MAYFNATRSIHPQRRRRPVTEPNSCQGTDLVARLVEELGGERTGTYACTIGLEDAIDISNLTRSHAQTRAGTRTDGVGRSNERIGTEIDVEHRALCTLAEDGLAFVQEAVDFVFAVHQLELLQVFDAFEPGLFGLSQVVFEVQALEYLLVAGFGGGILLVEVVQQVAHAQTVATHLVGIGRTDALACRPHFGIALGSLISGVEQTVGRHDEMSLLRNVKALLQVVTRGFERFGLSLEEGRVEHHAVTDDIHLVALKNSRRNRAEYILLAFELQRMAGIRATLKTGHHVIARRQYVDDFAFAFVAPL